MTIGIGQAFCLVGAGLLAGFGLFVWLADRLSRRYGEFDSFSGCLTALFVSVSMLGSGLLLWMALS